MSLTTQDTTVSSDPLVLLHGAWQDGRCWRDVAAVLEAQGRQVFTPTMAGHGPNANRAITLADCVESIRAFLLRQKLSRVTLVAHSFAGLVAPLVAEALPDRIGRLVFLDALIPVQGQNAFYGIPPEANPPLIQGDNGTVSLSLPTWLERFWQDDTAPDPSLASLERGETIWQTLLSPQPLSVALEPIPLSRFFELNIPTTYLLCRQDQVFGDPGIWRVMAARLPQAQVLEMDSGHEPMFTRPFDLAGKLLEASQLAVARAA
jgi:pimeloyl-ACP methyl ester carboxylesterase